MWMSEETYRFNAAKVYQYTVDSHLLTFGDFMLIEFIDWVQKRVAIFAFWVRMRVFEMILWMKKTKWFWREQRILLDNSSERQTIRKRYNRSVMIACHFWSHDQVAPAEAKYASNLLISKLSRMFFSITFGTSLFQCLFFQVSYTFWDASASSVKFFLEMNDREFLIKSCTSYLS